MKKFLLALMLLPLLGTFSSCSDDSDDLPEVDIKVVISGGTQDPTDNTIHVMQGTPLVIESLTAEPRNGKDAVLGMTTYYINGLPALQTNIPPFTATINTDRLAPGSYILQIRTTIFQVDKSAATCVLGFKLIIDIPDDEPTDTPGESPAQPTELTLIPA